MKDEEAKKAAEAEYPYNGRPVTDSLAEILRTAFIKGAQWQEAQGWISVEESPLKKSEVFQVFDPNDNTEWRFKTAWFSDFTGKWHDGAGDVIHPTHYRALPSPPINKLKQ